MARGFLTAAILIASPAFAADPAKPPRDVTCVYQVIPPEMRAVMLDLLGALQERGANPLTDPDAQIAIEAQIGSAFDKCLDLYPLSSGEAATARSFAFASVLTDFASRWLTANGGTPDDVLRYYEVNRARLPLTRTPTAAEIAERFARLPPEIRRLPPEARRRIAGDWVRRDTGAFARRPDKQEAAALAAHLRGRGWKFDHPGAEGMAVMLLHLQMQLALTRRAFANGGF